jgi:hypothetical protein
MAICRLGLDGEVTIAAVGTRALQLASAKNMTRLDKRYDFDALARAVTAARVSGLAEPPRFEGFQIEEVRSVMDSAVDFPTDVPEADRRSLLWKGLVRAAETPSITGDSLRLAIRDVEAEYLRQRRTEFVIATSISLQHFSALRRASVHGELLVFSRRLPSTFSRVEIQQTLSEHTAISTADRFTAVRIPVVSRTAAGAFESAMNRLDLWRALWNLTLNRRALLRRSSGARVPVNLVRVGPVHTLHSKNGKLASQQFWYEPEHLQWKDCAALENEYLSLKAAERRHVRKLARSQYRADLDALLIRYVRALDVPDYDIAFNRLWGVFEGLGGSVGNYDRLINRTISIYANDPDNFSRQVFEHLRDVRNGIVHEDRAGGEMETYLYQLKRTVEDFFRFHLGRGLEFRSLALATEFLDLPADPAVLRDQIGLRRRALQFRKR